MFEIESMNSNCQKFEAGRRLQVLPEWSGQKIPNKILESEHIAKLHHPSFLNLIDLFR